MKLSDLTLRACVLKVLADEIAVRLAEAKEAAEAAFSATGTTQAVPSLPDGTVVATVSYAGTGGKSARVSDERALMEWMLANHPGETEVIIRPGSLKKILDNAKTAGKAVDPVTGEVIPGITVAIRQPYVSIRFKPGGQDAVVTAWRAGDLTGIELTAPPAIPEAGAA